MVTHQKFFGQVSDGFSPRQWQSDLAAEVSCENRMVHAGTGLGKTLGAATAWAYRRLINPDSQNAWPRRLVWCLPMRVLVEQTRDELKTIAAAIESVTGTRVPVHALMGGVDMEPWHLHPEQEAMFVGTQDMLVSAAINRGYGSARGRWPMEFALLNQDCLWVLDEVQIQGVAAVTATQLQTFRDQELAAQRLGLPSYTWWMSATLRSRWVETVDSRDVIERADTHRITVPEADKSTDVYTATKPIDVQSIEGNSAKAAGPIADLILQKHQEHSPVGQGRVTLAVFNTVPEAIAVHGKLAKALGDNPTDLKLIHSRFRGQEREQWREGDQAFLSRKACSDSATDRIIIATQVVEAGVDISASCLLTELAPWPSMVQRFGRAARYGGEADITVIDRGKRAKAALPYEEDSLIAALEATSELDDVGLQSLDQFDARLADDLTRDQRLFDFQYIHQFQRDDLEQLFDTSPDLTGDDIDISVFIREGEDSNVKLAWFDNESIPVDSDEEVEETNRRSLPPKFHPKRRDLCPAGIADVKDFLFKGTASSKHFEKCGGYFVFHYSFEDSQWMPIRSKYQIRAGQTLLLDSRIGGYDRDAGFTGQALKKKETFPSPINVGEEMQKPSSADSLITTDFGLAEDPISVSPYQSIGDHGAEVATKLESIADQFDISADLRLVLRLSAEWHDIGKAHPAFRCNIRSTAKGWQDRDDIAKAPGDIWVHYNDHLYSDPDRSGIERFESIAMGKRDGIRHELASMLAAAEVIAAAGHDHLSSEKLFGEPFDRPLADSIPPQVKQFANDLSDTQVDLLLYLIVAHHGKVRGGLQMTPQDQDFRPPLPVRSPDHVEPNGGADLAVLEPNGVSVDTLPIRGVREGDRLSSMKINVLGEQITLPEIELHTDLASMGWSDRYGFSWSQRVADLQPAIGIFELAFLETLLRAADVRVSRGVL